MSATPKHFDAGQFLFREGEHSDCIYLIQTGTVAIRKKKSGGYIELGRVHANEVIGEMTLFDQNPRSASAIAITDVEALQIDFSSMEAIFKKIPSYFRTIVAQMAERLRKADDQLRQLKTNVISESDGVVTMEDSETDEEPLDTASVLDELDDEESNG